MIVLIVMMSHLQYDRIRRSKQDAIFLLDSNVDTDTGHLSVNICGNSRNVYTVSLSRTRNEKFQWKCNCPDMLMHARKSGCVCKHVCFLIYKVANAHEPEALTTREPFPMDEITLNQFVARLENRTELPASVFDQGLALKFTDKNFSVGINAFLPSKDARIESATCPVCFDSIDDNLVTSCHMCPACKNLVHKTCMEKYAIHKNNQVSCIYCRSTAWMSLYSKQKQQKYMRL